MKCWYRPATDGDDDWTEGWIRELSRENDLVTIGNGSPGKDATLAYPKYVWLPTFALVSGMMAERDGKGEFVYRRVWFEVSFSNPKEKRKTK